MLKKSCCLLLSLFCALLLCACASAPSSAEVPPTPPIAEATPTPEPSKTPCPHEWKDGACLLCGEACPHEWENGVCLLCGEPCPHEWEDGVCLLCGQLCLHEAHDADAVCLRCGAQCWHRYESGLCTGCGREPLLFDDLLPEEYLRPAAHQGQCLEDTITWPGGRSYPLSVYLPYGYDENGRYDLVIVALGDNNHAPDCTETVHKLHKTEIVLSNIYDHLIEEHLCAPFILVGLEHVRSMPDFDFFDRLLRESLFPTVARNYATWLDPDDPASWPEVREHVALCGISRGAVYTLHGGMQKAADLIGNFCCLSMGTSRLSVVDALRESDLGSRSIHCFVGVTGYNDPLSGVGDVRSYRHIVDGLDCLQDGENAFFVGVHDAHNWVTWSAGLFAALQYMF